MTRQCKILCWHIGLPELHVHPSYTEEIATQPSHVHKNVNLLLLSQTDGSFIHYPIECASLITEELHSLMIESLAIGHCTPMCMSGQTLQKSLGSISFGRHYYGILLSGRLSVEKCSCCDVSPSSGRQTIRREAQGSITRTTQGRLNFAPIEILRFWLEQKKRR